MTLRNIVPSFGRKKVPVRHRNDNPFNLLHENMNSLVDNFFRGFNIDPFGGNAGSFSPDVEVSENDKEIRVTAELAGLDEKDIDIYLSNETLTISGEKKEEKESRDKGFYVKERSYGSFKRTIPLYSEIETEKVDAHFKKGVLTVKLPKSAKEIKGLKKVNVEVG